MSSRTKVQHAEAVIRELVETGRPGDRLPSESELAALSGVSRVTVRDALVRLWTEGAVVRRWGVGTYVAERQRGPAAAGLVRSIYVGLNGVRSLPGEIADAGHRATLSSFSVVPADPPAWVRETIAAEGRLWLVTRVLAVDDVPAILLRDYLPAEIGAATLHPTDLGDVRMDLPRFLRQNGVRVVKHESHLDATLADEDSARALGLEPGVPLLRARQQAISDAGDVVACAEILYRSDVHDTVLVRTVAE